MSKQQPANPSGPSLEINLSEIENIASRLDADASLNEPASGRRQKRVKKNPGGKSAPKGSPDNPEVIPGETKPPPPLIDPEFESMLLNGTSQGITIMRDRFNLMEPGDTMRENVGKCLVRLVGRLRPMEPGPMSDVVTALGYMAVWVSFGRQPKQEGGENA